MSTRMFSSESVTSGHPDKVCDAISDAIVDACLVIDQNARVAVETCIKGMPEKSVIILAGEVSLEGDAPDYVTIARKAAAEIGYTSHDIGMDATDPSLCATPLRATTNSNRKRKISMISCNSSTTQNGQLLNQEINCK